MKRRSCLLFSDSPFFRSEDLILFVSTARVQGGKSRAQRYRKKKGVGTTPDKREKKKKTDREKRARGGEKS